ncbi:MAG TPA: hypothetical protein VMT57_09705 [Candidatus Thermoplasmatota archaeon]|nr:hypothetical protein [Candidatus Thermoplasmatota archaeon]
MFLPIILVVIILAVVGTIVAIKDKEFIRIISDERTKKVDRSAGYYSWWFSVLFIYVFGVLAEFEDFTPLQTISVILLEMFLTLILLHMYFNFKGKE